LALSQKLADITGRPIARFGKPVQNIIPRYHGTATYLLFLVTPNKPDR
jgi:hypothetical protein